MAAAASPPTNRAAALLHDRQSADRRAEADEIDLQGRKDRQSRQSQRTQQRRDAMRNPVEHPARLEQSHQREHDHHHRQDHEEHQFNGRASGTENGVDDQFQAMGSAVFQSVEIARCILRRRF
jgi:hypothetical protein